MIVSKVSRIYATLQAAMMTSRGPQTYDLLRTFHMKNHSDRIEFDFADLNAVHYAHTAWVSRPPSRNIKNRTEPLEPVALIQLSPRTTWTI